jgi:hypothetical protein
MISLLTLVAVVSILETLRSRLLPRRTKPQQRQKMDHHLPRRMVIWVGVYIGVILLLDILFHGYLEYCMETKTFWFLFCMMIISIIHYTKKWKVPVWLESLWGFVSAVTMVVTALAIFISIWKYDAIVKAAKRSLRTPIVTTAQPVRTFHDTVGPLGGIICTYHDTTIYLTDTDKVSHQLKIDQGYRLQMYPVKDQAFKARFLTETTEGNVIISPWYCMGGSVHNFYPVESAQFAQVKIYKKEEDVRCFFVKI